MVQLSKATLDAEIEQVASNPDLHKEACADPKSYVEHHFDLSDTQRTTMQQIPDTHWHEIAEGLSKLDYARGDSFHYVLGGEPEGLTELEARLSAGCTWRKKPDGSEELYCWIKVSCD